MALLLYMSYGAVQFGTYYELKRLYGGYVRLLLLRRHTHTHTLTHSLARTRTHAHTLWHTVAPTAVGDGRMVVCSWCFRRCTRHRGDVPVRPAAHTLCRRHCAPRACLCSAHRRARKGKGLTHAARGRPGPHSRWLGCGRACVRWRRRKESLASIAAWGRPCCRSCRTPGSCITATSWPKPPYGPSPPWCAHSTLVFFFFCVVVSMTLVGPAHAWLCAPRRDPLIFLRGRVCDPCCPGACLVVRTAPRPFNFFAWARLRPLLPWRMLGCVGRD
jgi:hypothetical protein